MARWRDDIGERRAKAGIGSSLAQTGVLVAVFYLALILLNGDAVYRNAEQMPYGPVREVSLRLTAPLRWVSRATQLYRVREWIEQVRNKERTS